MTQFASETEDYLRGEKFSSGINIKVCGSEWIIPDSISLICNMVKGKNVVHVGCCDHVPLILEKIKKGIHLHTNIVSVANRCIGIDINREAILYLRYELGYGESVFCADITKDNIPDINVSHWDYAVLGAMLEHVKSPYDFLKTIKYKYSGTIDRLLITVPNATGYANIKAARNHSEFVNTDHRWTFTPFTLAKIITDVGMTVEEFGFCEPQRVWWNDPRQWVRNIIVMRKPALRELVWMVVNI